MDIFDLDSDDDQETYNQRGTSSGLNNNGTALDDSFGSFNPNLNLKKSEMYNGIMIDKDDEG